MCVSGAIVMHPTITPSSLAVLENGLAHLRVRERHRPAAHRRVELVLDPVDLGGARIGLRPEIARVDGVAAELEADEVILLIVGFPAPLAVLAHLLYLQRVRVL